MTIPQITITAPVKEDMDSQDITGDQPPRLWIAGVQIVTPCQNLDEARRSLEFLQSLQERARVQHDRVQAHSEKLRQRQILEYPDSATEKEVEEAFAREYAEPPEHMIFYHGDGAAQPRTVWAWGSDMITHYNSAGEEVGALPVEPATIVVAAVRASTFGPIVSLHGRGDLDGNDTDPAAG